MKMEACYLTFPQLFDIINSRTLETLLAQRTSITIQNVLI
jgi:hypothetical protein